MKAERKTKLATQIVSLVNFFEAHLILGNII